MSENLTYSERILMAIPIIMTYDVAIKYKLKTDETSMAELKINVEYKS